VSNPDIKVLTRDYRFRLERAERCESCRHVAPLPLLPNGARIGPDATCRLLNHFIDQVGTSGCPGYQEDFYRRREQAGRQP